MTNSKTCTKCHTTKPLEGFAIKRNSRAATCKECQNVISRTHYEANRQERTKEIHARNKAVYAQRAPYIAKAKELITCSHCQGRVHTPDLSAAQHQQLGEARFNDALTAIKWECWRCRHTGVADWSVKAVMRRVINTLTPVYDVVEAVRAIRPATIDQLAAALCELTADGEIWEPIPGWVQLASTHVSATYDFA